ncbi:MAG: FecR domain-containing protein [Prevotella sp.]|nr:FecR domain-containing protein [Prevotella sp.]
MTKEENYTSLQPEAFLLPTEAEERDIRSALVRRMAPAPDVDAAWRSMTFGLSGSKVTSFANSRATQSETARLQSMTFGSSAPAVLRKVAVLAAAVAACGLLFFWLTPKDTVKDTTSGITILAQTAAGTEVTMTVERGEWDEARGSQGEQRVVSEKDISFENSDVDQSAMPSVILMTTPRGKDYHLTLADGTRVWMNADSQLEFPEQFNGARRTVRLHGEAYFEVAKDRRHPFVVETDYLTTTVLGTSFNVRAYSQNDAGVALVEGSVSVKSGRENMLLKPGQLVQVANGKLKTENVNTYGYTQRKDGYFYFTDDTMRGIMAELGRWYNKTVVFEEASDMDIRLHFVADRTQSLPQIINSLCEMDGVDIELGSDEIVVK